MKKDRKGDISRDLLHRTHRHSVHLKLCYVFILRCLDEGVPQNGHLVILLSFLFQVVVSGSLPGCIQVSPK